MCLSSVATFNSNRRRNLSPKNESGIGSPASRLFDLTSSMQNKQQPSQYPSFRSRLKVAKTKRGHSFKLKCTSVQQGGEQSPNSNPEGLANMRLSVNFDYKRRSNPETQFQAKYEHLDRIIELAEVEKHERDLNDSDVVCLESLRETLTAKKTLPVLSPAERFSHFSRDSADE